MIRTWIRVLASSLVLPAGIHATVTMPHIFGNHMVLQEGIKLPIWGRSDPGDSITVSIGGKTGTATADATGHWKALLDPLPVTAAPLELDVNGSHGGLKFTDVVIGDVFFFTGQSNMNFTVGNMLPDPARPPADPEASYIAGKMTPARVAELTHDPLLRYFVSGHQIVGQPVDDCPGVWEVVTPDNVVKCSAVAFFTAKSLEAAGHKPIGAIVTGWGGAAIQYFLSLDVLKSNPAFSTYVAEYNAAHLPMTPVIKSDPNATVGTYREGKRPKAPSIIYNGMIHPIMGYGIKGMVWFHGASNAQSVADGQLYLPMQKALIESWRKGWGQGDIPFVIEQINCFDSPREFRSEVENSQMLASREEPATALSVSIDIGEQHEGHFKDKIDIGARIAQALRALAFGENVVGSGPIFKSAVVEGDRMRVSFTGIGSGLTIGVPPVDATCGKALPMPDKLSQFEICGSDGKWTPANARIDGDTVVVSSPQVTSPTAVRYAWQNWPIPCANLYNKEGLPASPFASNDTGRH